MNSKLNLFNFAWNFEVLNFYKFRISFTNNTVPYVNDAPSFICPQHEPCNNIRMMKATNFIVFDKSFQASSLGDTSLISIVGTIQVLLGVLEELLCHQRRECCWKSPLLNGYIKWKRRSLISLRNEYGNLFDCAYHMDYASFQFLHELLKDGILQYIRQSDSSPNYSQNPSFFVHNGNITTEIRLACASCYFAGGSYLDITMSHAIGVTDFYLSIWAIVDATNRFSSLNFQFPTTESECQVMSTKFAARSKVGFTNCIGCINGWLIWLEKPSKKQ